MKAFGVLLVIAGLVWGLIAFNMDTTVTTESETVGSGEYSIYMPSQTVNNLGLMETRRNHLMFSGLTILVGVLLFGFGSISTKSSEDNPSLKPCPICAEKIQIAAVKCRFCGTEISENFRSKGSQIDGANLNITDVRLSEILTAIENGSISYQTYVEAINRIGGTLTVKGTIFPVYTLILDGVEHKLDDWNDLKPLVVELITKHK